MPSSFQMVGIDPSPFEPLFDLSAPQLAELGARRCIADESPGYPCRISLEEAQLGEELLLLPYLHQPAPSPYRASGPIFVRRGVARRRFPAGVVPGIVQRRLISVRAYSSTDLIVDASVCEGSGAANVISTFFGREEVAYIHLHNAKRGCFACEVIRA